MFYHTERVTIFNTDTLPIIPVTQICETSFIAGQMNVWKSCSDWYGEQTGSTKNNPTGPFSGFNRVFRGGSWLKNARGFRASRRQNLSQGFRDNNLGFHLARTHWVSLINAPSFSGISL